MRYATSSIIALLVAAPAAFAAPPALPAGGTFVAGSGSVSSASGTETITVNTHKSTGTGVAAVINWPGGYDVGKNDTVQYKAGSSFVVQPGSGRVVVNTDASGTASQIDGTIKSPNFAQVLVNPDGVSVGSNAVLPGSVELEAGKYHPVANQISATKAPVTISTGATFGATNADAQAGASVRAIQVTAGSGDTLPDEREIGQVSVVVQTGSNDSFQLSPGGFGSVDFGGTNYTAPGHISVVGPAGGATVRTVHLIEPVGVTFDAKTQKQVYRQTTGSLSISDITSSGSILASTGQTLTASGKIDGKNGVTLFASTPGNPTTSASGVFEQAPPSSAQTAPVEIKSGTTIDGSQVNVEGDYVRLAGPVRTNAAQFSILANHAVAPAASAGVTISDSSAQALTVEAPGISNLSLSAPAGAVDLSANSLNNVSASAKSSVSVTSAAYEASAPDGKGLSITGSTLDTKYATKTGSQVQVNASSGITIDSSKLSAPTGLIAVTSGGAVSVGQNSTLTTDPRGGCTAAGFCSTQVKAGTITFAPGNRESAADANLVSTTGYSGTPHATPGETTSGSFLGRGIDIRGTSAKIAGTLNAGTPPVGSGSVGSTGTGSTGTSGTGSTGNGGNGGNGGTSSTGNGGNGGTGSTGNGGNGGTSGTGSTGNGGNGGTSGTGNGGNGGTSGNGSTGNGGSSAALAAPRSASITIQPSGRVRSVTGRGTVILVPTGSTGASKTVTITRSPAVAQSQSTSSTRPQDKRRR